MLREREREHQSTEFQRGRWEYTQRHMHIWQRSWERSQRVTEIRKLGRKAHAELGGMKGVGSVSSACVKKCRTPCFNRISATKCV